MAQYKVWHNNNRGEYQWPVASPADGAKMLDELAQRDLVDKRITFNLQGLLVWEDGEWTEWYDDEGSDIRAYDANFVLID